MPERVGRRKEMATHSVTVSAQRTAARQTGLARLRAIKRERVLEKEIPLAKLTWTGKGILER